MRRVEAAGREGGWRERRGLSMAARPAARAFAAPAGVISLQANPLNRSGILHDFGAERRC